MDIRSVTLTVVTGSNYPYYVLKARGRNRVDLVLASGLLGHILEPESAPIRLLLQEALTEALADLSQ